MKRFFTVHLCPEQLLRRQKNPLEWKRSAVCLFVSVGNILMDRSEVEEMNASAWISMIL